MLIRPAALPRTMAVNSATAARASWLVRMVGGREIALGVGMLIAAGRGLDLRPWLLAQAMSDAGDAIAITAGLRGRHVGGRRSAMVVAFALAGVAIEAVAVRELSRG